MDTSPRPATAAPIRAAVPADAERLSAFMARTFVDTYGAENTPEDMTRYVGATFSPALQARELADPGAVVLVAEAAGSPELAAYAHLAGGPAPAAVMAFAGSGPAPVELKRFYVDQSWHGRGLAGALMDAVLGEARARGAGAVWLGVWQRNPRAVRFYEKCGFRRVGEATFVLGSDVQHDWIMARALDA